MLKARFRPLTKWPGKLANRNGQFRSTYIRTLDLLEYELRRIRARDVTIEAGFEAQQLRNDGWPRAGARPSHPGVVLYCVTPDGPLRFACATFCAFEQNMHAIGLTLEALRAVERFGATEGHEQYRGFAALPPAADESSVSRWTLEEAASWLAARTPWCSGGAELLENYEAYRRAYREAAAKLHPDVTGSPDGFHALQAAAELMEEHHKRQCADSS